LSASVAVEWPVITNLKDFGLQAAIDGLGIAFGTQQMIAPHVAAGRLVMLLEPWSGCFLGTIYVIRRSDRWRRRCEHSSIRFGPSCEHSSPPQNSCAHGAATK
jgi:DNA-binding transcriptional LysR family regulator